MAEHYRPPVTFTAWLRRQDRRDDPVGDLARDWNSCAGRCRYCNPTGARRKRPHTPQGARSELAVHGAPDPVVEVLDRAVREWQTLVGLPAVGLPEDGEEEC